ncbi:IclR family transcriptional regulator domain-containing protein [Flavilitoribacter nigricans]|uniref:IclR family transcriptional regulator n=1 Tax=Flavilitoribacter nigricans (strain ATCC 23147 / DSM 23189 / NBRC 102662 / NCIMB 1420 / SS-2) TaxID=1122177 RepID=A0A2D0N7S0_FLAN2|nr:IclR family transcriptional regulator C-terminal domain-containing protein [Flavilitoribacter nigricans]PHN04561.1 IclR family transcriptional regulator [Flavilitoribacter nigricans DSM 23189 = NBRC 102662]
MKSSDYVQSLEKGLNILRVFDREHPRLTLSEVAELTGLTRASARRFLLTFAHLNYMDFDGKYFSLNSKILDLGYNYLSTLSLPEVAAPVMKNLSQEVNESCSISVLEGTDIQYIAREQTSRIMTITLGIGTRLPAHITSMGRILLASLPPEELSARLAKFEYGSLTEHTIHTREALEAELHKVKRQGWCLVDQELESGLRSIAAPIRGKELRVIAAMNISAHASRVTRNRLIEIHLPQLLRAAAAISDALQKQ